MPYEKGILLIENDRQSTLPPINETAKENARKVLRIIYDLHPDIDEKGSLWGLQVIHRSDGVIIEFENPSCAFNFKCLNDGVVLHYQVVRFRGDNAPDYKQLFDGVSEKEIIAWCKRKRIPYARK